jgi:hypothetical protein
MNNIDIGRMQHYKGGIYVVLGVAQHTETEENLVIYAPEDDPNLLWVRPYDMFMGYVETPNGLVRRFTPID